MIKKVKENKEKALLILVAIIISITSFAFTYGVVRTFGDANTVSEGTTTDTVYVNDFAEDYYYYTGQNYTYSANMTTPTLEDKDLYNDSNLVEVTINYHGTDKENKYTGYVSDVTNERQSKFVYYKIYPVESGYINIELIDNPFTDHPDDLFFNGWITDYQGATISYDSVYYERSARVPVTMSNGTPQSIEINMYARWTKGVHTTVGGSRTWTNAFNDLETATMHQIVLDTNLYQNPDVNGYYVQDTITTVSTVTGSWWNSSISTDYATCTDCYETNHTYHGTNNPYQCPAPNVGNWPSAGTYTNDCTVYYMQTANDTWDPNKTYYEYRNGQYRVVNLQPTIIGQKPDDLFDSNMNMAGYYRQVTRSRNQSIEGYYNANGVIQSGNCTSNSCTVYELIQYYGNNNTPNLYQSNQTYYYLTTRDTNVVVMTANMNNSWSNTFTKPFTLTGLYNNNNYDPTWNVSSTSVIAYTNLRIENLTINAGTGNANTNPNSGTNASGVFYGNYFDVKLGRNIKRSGTNVSFVSYEGGMNVSNSTVGSSSAPKKFKMEIESGFYNSGTATFGATQPNRQSTLYVEAILVFGNDYDRVKEDDTKLDLYYSTAASWTGNIYSGNDTYNPCLRTIVKSGYLGSGHNDLTTGVYVGARYNGSHYAPREMKMEGGHIYNIVGAPSTDSSKSNLTASHIYMTGGIVDLLTAGAGTSTTYGNRITQVTGGTVRYGVVGGSNGRDGTSSDGTLTGDSYVYIGGTAVIGDMSVLSNNTDTDDDMYGVAPGTVFGAGNGNQTYDTIGSVKNSNIVINDEAVINSNVFGSGNFGTAGYSATQSSTTNIKLVGGTVRGSVFGSGNNSGSGKVNAVVSTINITLDGGTVIGNIYGGSNVEGIVYGSTNVNIVNGTVTDVYGGGYGEDTYVERNILVTAGSNATTDLTVNGDVYGGSAFGTVNATSAVTTASSYTTQVNVVNGDYNSVYGGGKGDSTHSPLVAGNITVNVSGGSATNVFGGNNANGTPLGTVIVNISGGESTNVYGGNNAGGTVPTTQVNVTGGNNGTIYGGGKLASSANTNVDINGGTCVDVFGGGESANVTTKSTVLVESGTITGAVYGGSNQNGTVLESAVSINSDVPTVYGGNNAGGTTTTTTVNLVSGNITAAYGGGKNAESYVTTIKLNGASVGSVFGGGNSAGANTTTVELITGSATNVFGGSDSSGTVLQSNVVSNNASNLIVTSVYGGNNAGGKTTNTTVNLTGGTFTDVYGGGLNAQSDYTIVNVNGVSITGNFYGGGKVAAVNYNTTVNFISSTISGDLFGGGDQGEVLGTSTVKIDASTVNGSAYAGGNGSSAVVHGNTNITVHNSSIIRHHVFGGGKAADTGTSATNNTISHVNIAGATIHGNVYGGANTATVYGTAIVNIGYSGTGITQSNIHITGTVFGGGEANASGSPVYDFSFIGVTRAIEVNIDGAGYNSFTIGGSIFGSGNASSTSGTSVINISNYGTFANYKENVSIQRTDELTIKNSAIKLSGATDRTNEYSDVMFSLSRIDKLVLANDSTLFLDEGANLLKSFYSEKITGSSHAKASVTILDDGTTTRTVNNRVYMLEGKNLNIAITENLSAFGRVSGMTFFGMYKIGSNNRVITALYDNAYSNGDTVTGGVLYAFTLGSYVWGKHHDNHNIKEDGFYTNYPDEPEENVKKIRTDYIEPSPPDAAHYRWVIGETVTTYDVNLSASKYATLGTVELPLGLNTEPNTTFEITGFNYDDLESGFVLDLESNIPRLNNQGTADTKMALKIEPSNTGFITTGSTQFITDPDDPVVGTKKYTSENSNAIPSLLFYLFHSKNISLSRDIGTVVITMEATTPIDDLNDEVSRVNINVNLSSALYNNNEYEGAMTTGEKYSLFASTATNINTKSKLSAYYSLFMETNTTYYRAGYHHALVSDYVLPLNTKITMIDLIDNNTYYYIIDQTAVDNATTEFNLVGDCSYNLSNFIKMGSTSTNNNFNENDNTNKYYDSVNHQLEEEFIFIVNFEDTDIQDDVLDKKLLLELRSGTNNTLISVLGIEHSALTYNLYEGSNAIMDISGSLSSNPVYIGDTVNLNLTGNFTQPVVNSLPVVDTSHFDKKPGVKLTIYNSNNNQLNNSSLLGLYYEVDGEIYYPRIDGTVRIALADRVANIFKRIKIHTENCTLISGNYTLKAESFTSPDGIYYGRTPQDTLNIPFTIINSSYGLKIKLTDNEMMIDKTMGYTLNNNNMLNFSVEYSSTFANPNIHVKLYRREYDEAYDYDYTEVDIENYITNVLTPINGLTNEYMFITNPTDGMNQPLYLKTLIRSGTYKFEFSLYDGDEYIGDCHQYVIIK